MKEQRERREPVEDVDKDRYYEKERPVVAFQRQCGRFWKNFNQFMRDARVYESIEIVAQYLKSNPVLLAACIAAVSAVAIPLLLFILFAAINITFIFTCFVVIEVTVLTIGATVLCCVLFFLLSTIKIVGVCMVLTYFTANYVLSLIKNMKTIKR